MSETNDNGTGAGRTQPLGRVLGPVVVAVAAATMLALSWRRWPDVLIDFGQQLYLAWQMNEGRVLYADLVCNYGPLAPYANAWAFTLFGKSLMTLVGLNLAAYAGIAAVMHALLLRVASPVGASVGSLLFALVFAFSQLSLNGNYNYATPYENSLTIGLLPALVAVWLALRHVGAGGFAADAKASVRTPVAVGLALGLALLTKPEVFLAGFAGVAASWLAAAWNGRCSVKRLLTTSALSLGAGAVVFGAAVAMLATAMPVGTAWRGALGSWPAVAGSAAASLEFYRSGMGTDDVAGNLGKIALVALVWLAIAGAQIGIGRLPAGLRQPWVAGVTFLVVAIAGWFVPNPTWHEVARPLQVAMVLLAGASAVALWRRRPEASVRIPQLGLAVFALALLAKMLLNVRVYHYGFVLAMPAALLAAVAVASWLPRWIERRGGYGPGAAALGLGVLTAFVAAHIRMSNYELSLKTTPVGAGADRQLSDNRGVIVNRALELIGEAKPRTVAVFPEGTILNYLSGCPNPTPNYNYMPTGYAIYGEGVILQNLRANPPDLVVLVEKDTTSFGFQYFGTDYARQTGAFLRQNYQTFRVLGNRPLTGQGFGIELMRRR